SVPTLVRVHVFNLLSDALHWRRADFGPAIDEVLATIARQGRGALVLLGESQGNPTDQAEALLARIRRPHDQPASLPTGRRGEVAEWRRNGAGSQILADLGLGKLRVLGTPRRQVGLAGYGLEVVEYLPLPT
ncbi:MAG: bifunctional 3,4-dihydroxy-2-butanone-4-phosphate synthase/GTP cyclohydrolase II, partial [Luteimonas sp.]